VQKLIKNLKVSRETIEAFQNYHSLLLKWNKKINLISSKTEGDFWSRHIIDSLQLLQFINNNNIHLMDIGSGAGFPGIILSIAGIKLVTLVESDERKAAFLLQASKLSNNKINILNERVENLTMKCDILTCRAFASLNSIFYLTRNIEISQKYLLLKGRAYASELEEAKANYSFDYTIYESITSENSKILDVMFHVEHNDNLKN
jgi:16S rRNA (guanine527-N7)-methyltransferase